MPRAVVRAEKVKANNIKGRVFIPGRPKSRIEHDQLLALAALAETAPRGDFVEVGVYRGGSAWYLYAVCQRQHRDHPASAGPSRTRVHLP